MGPKAKDIKMIFPIILASCLAGKNFWLYLTGTVRAKLSSLALLIYPHLFKSNPNQVEDFDGIQLPFGILVIKPDFSRSL